jgi:hypothetical protein
MVSKIMAKLGFNYPLKYNLLVCHNFSIFPLDFLSFMWLAL